MSDSIPEIIPVLDIRDNLVVRGIAGERHQYQPNTSCLLNSAEPVLTTQAIHQQFNNEWLYVADLDGIQRQQPQLDLIKQLVETGVQVCIDAGIRSVEEIENLKQMGCAKVVIALETLPSLDWLDNLLIKFQAQDFIFSLDLKAGVPLHSKLNLIPPLELAKRVILLGLEHLIVLDLASVGTNRGVSTASLCYDIKKYAPAVVVWTGGGVRTMDDVVALRAAKVDGVLVASAIHDGHIRSRL